MDDSWGVLSVLSRPEEWSEVTTEVGHGSFASIIDVGFRNTSPRSPLPSIRFDSFNSADGDGRARRNERRKSVFSRWTRGVAYRAALTCPCCSAVPPLLDCSPWTDSCCCIHSSVSLQAARRSGTMKIVCYISRLTDRRNFSWETAPRQVFPPPRCKCNSTRCSLHFT